jgi:hypothetical protein
MPRAIVILIMSCVGAISCKSTNGTSALRDESPGPNEQAESSSTAQSIGGGIYTDGQNDSTLVRLVPDDGSAPFIALDLSQLGASDRTAVNLLANGHHAVATGKIFATEDYSTTPPQNITQMLVSVVAPDGMTAAGNLIKCLGPLNQSGMMMTFDPSQSSGPSTVTPGYVTQYGKLVQLGSAVSGTFARVDNAGSSSTFTFKASKWQITANLSPGGQSGVWNLGSGRLDSIPADASYLQLTCGVAGQ